MDGFLSKAALSVGGLAAIGAALFYGLYKEWLSLEIFSKISADQTFILMIIFLALVFLSLIALLATHVVKSTKVNIAKANNNSISIINTKE
jgi:hypothetical protein